MRPPLNAGEDPEYWATHNVSDTASMRPPLNAGEDLALGPGGRVASPLQ